MKKRTCIIFLRLIAVVLGLAALNVSPVSAQQSDERTIGEIATTVDKKLAETCEIFVERPENRGSAMKPDSTVPRLMICDLFTKPVFRAGYKALLYREVAIGTINQGATPEITRKNAYAKIGGALAQVALVQKGLDRIRTGGALTQKAGQIWAEVVVNSIVRTYAFEAYGIRPPQNPEAKMSP